MISFYPPLWNSALAFVHNPCQECKASYSLVPGCSGLSQMKGVYELRLPTIKMLFKLGLLLTEEAYDPANYVLLVFFGKLEVFFS